MGESVLVSEPLAQLAAAGAALVTTSTAAEVVTLGATHAQALGLSASIALFFDNDDEVQLANGERVGVNQPEPHAMAARARAAITQDGVWVIPLFAANVLLGTLAVTIGEKTLSASDQHLIWTFAYMCASALDRARLDEAERRVRAEAYRIYGQLETLARAGALVSTSRDVDSTVRTVVALPLSEFADGCIFEAIDDDLPALEVAHVEPEQEQTLREFFGPEASFRNPALRDWAAEATEALLLEDTAGFWQVGDPLRLAALSRIKMRSVIIVPLRERGRRLGMLTFVRMNEPYEDGDLPFAAELSRRLSSALENARLYDEAQRAIQLRDNFISIAAHELKTPLAALQMRLHMLVGKVQGTAVEASAARCEIYTRDLGALVNQLLDVTRITAGQMRLDLEPVDIVRVVQEVVMRYAEVAQDAGASVELSLPARMVGVWDKIKLEQVVGNLFTNAIKYGQGSPISLSITASADVCELVVRDSGGGIAMQEQALIFRRFHRVTTSGGGFGLGLWIVKQVVEALGGTVQVESAIGCGAAFTVRLPLTR